MKYLIPVFVGGATITVAVTTAIAHAHGAFNGHAALTPYLYGYGSAVVLLVIAVVMAVKVARQEKLPPSQIYSGPTIKQEASPQQHVHVTKELPVATPPINISLSNIGNPVVAFGEKSQRTRAQQHHYETAQVALRKLGPNAVIALRHLKTHRALVFGMYDPLLPTGMNHEQAMSIYQSCAAEGLVTQRDALKPGTAERTFEIAPTMNEVLDELLYGTSDGSAPMSHKSINVTKRD